VKGYFIGQIAGKFTKESIETIRSTGTEKYAGQMGENMLGSGQTESSMDRVNIQTLEEKQFKESGAWVRKSSDICNCMSYEY